MWLDEHTERELNLRVWSIPSIWDALSIKIRSNFSSSLLDESVMLTFFPLFFLSLHFSFAYACLLCQSVSQQDKQPIILSVSLPTTQSVVGKSVCQLSISRYNISPSANQWASHNYQTFSQSINLIKQTKQQTYQVTISSYSETCIKRTPSML